MKRKVIKYKLHSEVKLPKKFIDSIPRQGRADDAVKDIQTIYNVECDKDELIKYLKSTGGWSLDELQDHDDNIDRLIWISCLDCQEQSTTCWYMGC